jgi:hypothetical protein
MYNNKWSPIISAARALLSVDRVPPSELDTQEGKPRDRQNVSRIQVYFDRSFFMMDMALLL